MLYKRYIKNKVIENNGKKMTYTPSQMRANRRRYFKKKKLGLCTICNEPRVEDSSLCEHHKKAKKEYMEEYRKKKKFNINKAVKDD